jgi:hypothetical protein
MWFPLRLHLYRAGAAFGALCLTASANLVVVAAPGPSALVNGPNASVNAPSAWRDAAKSERASEITEREYCKHGRSLLVGDACSKMRVARCGEDWRAMSHSQA